MPRILQTTASLILAAGLAVGCSASGSSASDPDGDVDAGTKATDGAPATDSTTPLGDPTTPPTDSGGSTTPPGDSGGPPPTDSAPPPPPTDSGLPTTDTGPPPSDKPVCTAYVPPVLGLCASERWSVKVGLDSAACSIGLTPTATTIGDLRALTPPGSLPSSSRIAPVEDTVYLLRDVTLVEYKVETDRDYHLVIQDASGRTMIVEIPDPGCLPSSGPWYAMVKAARAAFDGKFPVSSSFRSTSTTVSVKGLGFFDVMHGQTGVAPNGIELHPLIGICFGAGCTP